MGFFHALPTNMMDHSVSLKHYVPCQSCSGSKVHLPPVQPVVCLSDVSLQMLLHFARVLLRMNSAGALACSVDRYELELVPDHDDSSIALASKAPFR